MKYTVTKLGESSEPGNSVLGNYLTELKLRHHTSRKASSKFDNQPELLQVPQADKDECRLVDMVSISKMVHLDHEQIFDLHLSLAFNSFD